MRARLQELLGAWEGKSLDSSLVGLDQLLTLLIQPDREQVPPLLARQVADLEKLGAQFAHRQLPGHRVWTESDVLKLADEDIDIARGLLISQFGEDRESILAYELLIDLMALEIQAKFRPDASLSEKINSINRYLFFDAHYRFPPMSRFSEEIDQFTFLPAVVDSKRGVCLGVSTLYLCLAQRLGIELEAVTPPGHIYVQTREPEGRIRIETTARGIHLPEEAYLGINTRALHRRNTKEVIGFTFFNQASVFSRQGEWQRAVDAYRRALPYSPEDPLIRELLAYHLLLAGESREALQILRALPLEADHYSLSNEGIAQDLLSGHADRDALEVLFREVDDERSAYEEKALELRKLLKRWPAFRAAWFHLGLTQLQLGQPRQAREALLEFHELDPRHVTVEFILAQLFMEIDDLPRAEEHLARVEARWASEEFQPVELEQLQMLLRVRGNRT